jgi:probable rRNA maturation factor
MTGNVGQVAMAGGPSLPLERGEGEGGVEELVYCVNSYISDCSMNIEITNLTKHRIDKKYFREIGKIVFKKLKQPKEAEVSLVFVGDTEMKKLNKKYRGKNKTTDVLSFNYGDVEIPPNLPFKSLRCNCSAINEKGGKLPPFSKEGWPARNALRSMAGGGGFLGEIVISIPQARLQCLAKHGGQAKKRAEKRNYPLKTELTELFVHGILHLVGYEDETEKEYKRMIKKQKQILGFLAKK